MTLFRAELARIAHRRLTKAAALIAAVGIVATGAIMFLTHSNAKPDWVQAQAAAERSTASCAAAYESDSPGTSAEVIEEFCYSDPAWFVEDNNFHLQSMLGGNGTESFDTVREQVMARSSYPELGGEQSGAYGYAGLLAGFGILITIAAAVLGASYVGADWRSGVIESQLVRQPNRAKLFAAKFGAIATTTATMATVVSVATLVAVVPAALWRGDTANTGTEFWLAAGAMTLRIGLVATLAAIASAGVTMVARNTAAGVGVSLAAFVVGGIAPALSGSWTRFVAVPGNLEAWLTQGDVRYQFTVTDSTGGTQYYDLMGHNWIAAGLLIAITALAATAIGSATFGRRDVN